MATKLRKLVINEISLVDKGANPGAHIVMFKRDDEPEDDETTEDPLFKRRSVEDDETGQRGRAPKDLYGAFQSSGIGPMTDKLWTAFDNLRRQMPARGHKAFALAWGGLSDGEKDEIRAEEAAVEAAKQAQADAKQTERQQEMGSMMFKSAADPNVVAKSDEDAVADATARIIKMAHDIVAGADNDVSRSNWYGVVKALAEQRRGPTETSAQAFTKFVTGDPDGRALFAALRSASGPDFVPEPVTAPVLKSDSAYSQLKKIASDIRAEHPDLTEGASFLRAYNENPELAARSKTEHAFA